MIAKFKNIKVRVAIITFLVSMFSPTMLLSIKAQNISPFKGHFYNKEENIHLYLDLYKPSLKVPNYEFLGTTNGYLNGNIYGVWLITKYKRNKASAIIRLSNDLGSDSQSIEIKVINDTTLSYKAVNGNDIKKVQKRKLVKINDEFLLVRQK